MRGSITVQLIIIIIIIDKLGAGSETDSVAVDSVGMQKGRTPSLIVMIVALLQLCATNISKARIFYALLT